MFLCGFDPGFCFYENKSVQAPKLVGFRLKPRGKIQWQFLNCETFRGYNKKSFKGFFCLLELCHRGVNEKHYETVFSKLIVGAKNEPVWQWFWYGCKWLRPRRQYESSQALLITLLDKEQAMWLDCQMLSGVQQFSHRLLACWAAPNKEDQIFIFSKIIKSRPAKPSGAKI